MFLPEKMGGYFEEIRKDKIIRHKNTLVAAGADKLMRTVFRAEAVLPATWYLGLTNAVYTFDTATLVALAAGEPVGNGYARIALNRDMVDWSVSEVNGVMQALSKIVTFVATGTWTIDWQRAFLCDQAAGTAGEVFAVSGPTPVARHVTAGQGPSLRYTYYFRG